MTTKITLKLPLPPKEVSPNARVHWAKLAAARKLQKQQVRLACHGVPAFKFRKATAQPTFYFATKRRRDSDNASSSLKATYDGLVAAGVLDDDVGLLPLPPIFAIDRKNPRLEIVITSDG